MRRREDEFAGAARDLVALNVEPITPDEGLG
jgi:hypothetical protein